MVKILEVFAEPISNGGQESFVMNVVQAIDMTGLSIDLLTPYYCDNNFYKRIIIDKGGHIYTWNLKFEPGKSRFFYIKFFKKFFKKHDYDVVHIHSGSISALAYISFAARKAKIKKIIVHSHATGNNNMKYKIVKFTLSPLLNKSATTFFACSKTAGEWKFSKTIQKDKLQIIKNGIDVDKFSFNITTRNVIRDELKIDKNTLLIGNVGRFSCEKNQSFIIEILHKLIMEEKDVKLLLIGSGETESELKNLVKKYNLENRVIFKGNVNNVYDYMQAMDVFVLPSHFEGLGIVAIEAQASGLPVIASTGVPNDIEITENVKRLGLDDFENWIKYIMQFKNICRCDTSELIKKAGFDIKNTSGFLKKVYQNDH